MATKFTYSIVIPSWKGVQLLKQNLPAVLKLSAQEVIVMDDASPEHDSDFVRENFSSVKTFRNEKNLGFGSNVNRGVSHATGDIVILLNLDAKPASDMIKYLDEDFQNDQVFAVSFAEEDFGPTIRVFQSGYIGHQPVIPLPAAITETFWVSGGSGAFRRSQWDQLRGLDPIFDPFYWEDVDLCIRAAKRGWKLLWDPRTKVVHKHEGTIGKHIKSDYKTRIQERNHLIITWKHLTFSQWPIHIFHLLKRVITHPGYSRIIFMAKVRVIQAMLNSRD